jgi:hypothetical protein
MTGSMQATTSFEIEAQRRQEVLLAAATSGVGNGTRLADAARATRRGVGRLAAAASMVALLATGRSTATGSTRS